LEDAVSKTIVLAVDTSGHELAEHVTAAVEMTKEVAHDDDKVIVLHVHEFAVGRCRGGLTGRLPAGTPQVDSGQLGACG
jgi:hypothetical protein